MDKPQYKTLSFWMTVAMTTVGFLLGSGLIVEGSTIWQVVGFLTTVGSALGYKAWGPVTIAQAQAALAKLPPSDNSLGGGKGGGSNVFGGSYGGGIGP